MTDKENLGWRLVLVIIFTFFASSPIFAYLAYEEARNAKTNVHTEIKREILFLQQTEIEYINEQLEILRDQIGGKKEVTEDGDG